MKGLFSKFRSGLSRTRSNLVGGISKAVTGKVKLDEETFETIEEKLIAADLGVDTSLDVIETLRSKLSVRDRSDLDSVLQILKDELRQRLIEPAVQAESQSQNGAVPHVILVSGVNGVGKTTTIGKLANLYRSDGKRVLIGAADTYRAAALQQLEIWAQRAGAEIVRNKPGADPASVAFDTIAAAQNRNVDVVIIDTAGRLHTKSNLMEELKKIERVIARRIPGAPHEVLLVLDAATGQNGFAQARQFKDAVHVTGVVLTKLDGTAKGGIVFAIQEQLGLPVQYIGVGEQIDDLQPFDPATYVEALFA